MLETQASLSDRHQQMIIAMARIEDDRRARELDRLFIILRDLESRQIEVQPTWPDDVPTPDDTDVDDLEALGLVEIDHNARGWLRAWRVSPHGRRVAAQLLATPGTERSAATVPAPIALLGWLAQLDDDEHHALAHGNALIKRSVEADVVTEAGLEAFARRILQLVEQGLVQGEFPLNFDGATGVQRLERAQHLAVTIQGRTALTAQPSSGSSMTFHGPVTAGQIARGNISNVVTLGQFFDRVDEAIDAVTDDPAERARGREWLDALRGHGTSVVTGAGAGVVAQAVALVLGLVPS